MMLVVTVLVGMSVILVVVVVTNGVVDNVVVTILGILVVVLFDGDVYDECINGSLVTLS